MKKVYMTPTLKTVMIQAPQLLGDSDTTIEMGGAVGGGNHGIVSNSKDLEFSEE